MESATDVAFVFVRQTWEYTPDTPMFTLSADTEEELLDAEILNEPAPGVKPSGGTKNVKSVALAPLSPVALMSTV